MPMQLLDPDGSEWAERSEFWNAYSLPQKRRGPKNKHRYREPLILCGHGIRIRVDHQTLLLRTGLTHYPQTPKEIRLFPGDAKLPDRIVILDGSGGVSFDALNWMSEQRVEFVRLNWEGKVTSIGNGSGYSANPKLAKAQRAIQGTRRQMDIGCFLIVAKLKASISTLQNSIPESENREIGISRLRAAISTIEKSRKSISYSQLLGLEGSAAGSYFAAWRGLPLKWTGLKKKPIPADWSEFGSRVMGWRKRSRAARHPINAMLNYGYGILANQVRSEVIAAGLDPTIGILHGNSENPNPLVYDFMEPLRPEIDGVVLEFVRKNMFSPGDFSISKWGGCRINVQIASILASQLSQTKFDTQSKKIAMVVRTLLS